MHRACAIVVSFLLSAPLWGQQKAPSAPGFLINPDRSFVYLVPDHIATSTLWEGKPEKRVWLRLVNNCTVPISLIANGAPDGSPNEEVALQYTLVANPPSMVVMFTGQPEKKAVQVPPGRSSDVGSDVTIEPGQSILWSLPANHFSNDWNIVLHLEFVRSKNATGERRDPAKWGGWTSMQIGYALDDLPKTFQDQIKPGK